MPNIDHLQSLKRKLSYTDLEQPSVCVVKGKGTVPKCILGCEIQQNTVRYDKGERGDQHVSLWNAAGKLSRASYHQGLLRVEVLHFVPAKCVAQSEKNKTTTKNKTSNGLN